MSLFSRNMIGPCLVIALYLGLLSGTVYILQNDTQDGKISLNQMIANEVMTIGELKLIYQAQKQYHAADWDQDALYQYAAFIAHLWQTVDQNADPVRINFIPQKLAFAMGPTRAIHGYYFQNIRVKEIQNNGIRPGASSKGRRLQLMDIDLTKEWATTAVPAFYGKTGVLSFIITSAGKIYAKDNESRSVKSISENLTPAGWTEIAGESDILNLHGNAHRTDMTRENRIKLGKCAAKPLTSSRPLRMAASISRPVSSK